MFKNRIFLTFMILALGIAVLGVANAANIQYGTLSQPAGQASTFIQASTQIPAPAPVTPDTVKQMIQACWQVDPAMVDQWVNATGLTKDDLLKMEQAWMQGVMQQNPELDVQTAFKMQQVWMENFQNSYTQVNQQSQQQPNTPAPAPAPNNNNTNPNNIQYNNGSHQYHYNNCGHWGYNNGYNGSGYGYGCW